MMPQRHTDAAVTRTCRARTSRLGLPCALALASGACTFDSAPLSPAARIEQATLDTQRAQDAAIRSELTPSQVTTAEAQVIAQWAAGAGASPLPPSTATMLATAGAAAGSDAAPTNVAHMSAPLPRTPTPDDADAGEREGSANDAAIPAEPARGMGMGMGTPPVAMLDASCRPGTYAGTLAGTLQLGPLALNTVAGTVVMELVATASPTPDRKLAIRKGRVEGLDQDMSKFSADLVGELDCQTGQLARTSVERGTYAMQGATPLTFKGTVQGGYVTQPASIVGTWSVDSADVLLLTGHGTWSATLSQVR